MIGVGGERPRKSRGVRRVDTVLRLNENGSLVNSLLSVKPDLQVESSRGRGHVDGKTLSESEGLLVGKIRLSSSKECSEEGLATNPLSR